MENQDNMATPQSAGYKPHVKHRNVVLSVIFSVITFGIYGLYWFVCLTNETNALSKYKTAGGVKALVFTVLTLGIYSFYWHYMLGKKTGDIEGDSSSGILYLILSLLALGFINYILAQSVLNRTAA